MKYNKYLTVSRQLAILYGSTLKYVVNHNHKISTITSNRNILYNNITNSQVFLEIIANN